MNQRMKTENKLSNQDEILELIRQLAETEQALSVLGRTAMPSDGSEEEQAQIMLRQSEERHHRLLSRLEAVVFELNEQGEIRSINQGIFPLTGYQPDEVTGKNWWTLFLADQPDVVADLSARLAVEDVSSHPLNLVTKNGSRRPVELTTANHYLSNGQLVRVVGLCLDVSRRQQAEEETRKQDQLIAAALQAAPIVLFIIGSDGRLQLTLGKSLSKRRGYRRPEGISIYEIYHDVPQVLNAFERAMLGEVVTTTIHADGIWYDVRYEPMLAGDGSVESVMGVAVEVSERKQAEEVLREREASLRLLLDQMPAVLWSTNRELEVMATSGAGLTALNLMPSELVGRHLLGNGPYNDVQKEILEHHRYALQGTPASFEVALTDMIFQCHVEPFHNSQGEIMGTIGVALDVSRMRQAERAARITERRYREIVETAGDGIVILNEKHRITFANQRFCEMVGFSLAELEEMKLEHILDEIGRWGIQQPTAYAGNRDARLIGKNGGVVHVTITTTALIEEGENVGSLAVVHDVSHRKELENELAELRGRLMDAGELERLHLAQELHDGPIQDLYGLAFQLSALREQVTGDVADEMQRSLDKVVQALRNVCGDLRPPTLTPFGLEKAIRSYLENFRQTHPEVELRLALQRDGQRVCEPVRIALYRIFQNSISNILRHASATRVEIRFLLEDDHVLLEISDNGVGFSLPERWIELVRNGHYGIAGSVERAEAVGGEMMIDTRPGRGTIVRVTAPYQIEYREVPT